MAYPVPAPPLDLSDSLFGKVIAVVRGSAPARTPCYQALWQLGVKLIMINPVELPVHAPYCAAWILCDTDDVDLMERKLRALLQDSGSNSSGFGRASGVPDGIITFDEYGVYPCAALCERFQLRPQPFGPDCIRLMNAKGLFRSWCFEHGVASPQSVSIERGETASEKIERLRVGQMGEPLQYPFVVKSSSGAGKIQTKLVATKEELDAHVPLVWEYIDRLPEDVQAKLRHTGEKVTVLVEEFIGGQEVDIDCIIVNGEVAFACVADNFPTKPPYFSEMGGLVPSALPPDAQLSLLALLRDFLRGHGDRVHGCLHFEAKYDPARPRKSYVVEVNGRLGGAETFQMTRTAYGVDLSECVARLAVGLPPFERQRACVPVPPPLDKHGLAVARCHAASVNILPPADLPAEGGILSEVRLPTFAEQGLVAALSVPVGRHVLGPPQEFYCLVWMVAWGRTGEEARANIDRLTAQVLIRCLPVPKKKEEVAEGEVKQVAQ